MVPREEVGLVLAEMGRQLNLIQPTLFTGRVLILAISSIVGPMPLKWALKDPKVLHSSHK